MHSLSRVYLVMGIIDMLNCSSLFLPGRITLFTPSIYILIIKVYWSAIFLYYLGFMIRNNKVYNGTLNWKCQTQKQRIEWWLPRSWGSGKMLTKGNKTSVMLSGCTLHVLEIWDTIWWPDSITAIYTQDSLKVERKCSYWLAHHSTENSHSSVRCWYPSAWLWSQHHKVHRHRKWYIL